MDTTAIKNNFYIHGTVGSDVWFTDKIGINLSVSAAPASYVVGNVGFIYRF